MSNENSNVTLGVLKYTINKLKGLLNTKADLSHSHAAKDIIEANDKQFINSNEKDKISKLIINGNGSQVLSDNGTYINLSTLTDDQKSLISKIIINGDGSQVLSNNGTYIDMLALTDEQKNLISKIIITGDGTKVLSDNGNYILMSSLSTEQSDLLSKIIVSGDGTKILSDNGNYINLSSTIIDDTTVNTSKTYSSSYINTELNKKASTKDLHSHTNKAILDKITDTGSKIEFLCADGTYKEISGGINDSNITSTTTLSATETVKRLDTKVDKINGKQLSTNDFTDDDKSKLSAIYVKGEPNRFLAKDGFYYKIDNCGINDDLSSTEFTYSSNKIDNKIEKAISNLVLPTQNDAPTIWQKVFYNVKKDVPIEIPTSLYYVIDKTLIQIFKYVKGSENLNRTINDFYKTEAEEFYYNADNIKFSDADNGYVTINDNYEIKVTKNDIFYESALIDKSEFIDLVGLVFEEVN